MTLRPLLLCLAVTAAPVSAGDTFRLVSYNIHHGEGTDGKLDLPRIAEFLKKQNPSAVVLQEVDKNCKRTGGVDQPAEFAKLTGMTATFFKAMDYDGGEYGICTLTHGPPQSIKQITLPKGGEPRVGLAVTLKAMGQTFTVANTHLDFAKGPERLAQAETLLKELAALPGPVILAGDFNAVRGDEVMNAVAAAGWSVPVKTGDPATIPSGAPKREIDFAVTRPAAAFRVVTNVVLDEPVASDHRAILFEVSAP